MGGFYFLPLLSLICSGGLFVFKTPILDVINPFAFCNRIFLTFDIMKLKDLIPYALAIILGLLLAKERNRQPETKTITRTVTVKVPEIIKQFDTIYKPIPTVIRETDTIILQQFLTASDSLKIALYLSATMEREYTQQFRDSVQEINVFSKVRGEMLAQSVDYHIFEREVSQTDTIELKGERNFYILPQIGTNRERFKASGSILYIDRKSRLYSLTIDSDGFFLAGIGIKF